MEKYQKQIDILVDYFKSRETRQENFKVGAEFEHFIRDEKTLETISYYGENGVEDTLKKLLKKGWKGKYEGQYLLALEKEGTTVTLEPGAQVELSVKPYKDIKDIEREYVEFLKDIIPILEEKNQYLISLGYQPKSKVKDIKFIPKERYKYMSEYFKTRGYLAHNMMKGTASTQVAVDYKSEEDYIKKFRVCNLLVSVVGTMFDNAPFFEGKLWEKFSLRTNIWQNTDADRCSVVQGALDKKFGYKDYAKYILNTPPILVDNGKEVKYTADKPYKEIFNVEDYTIEELEHILTMVFPDVRTKKFIEIRMADALPYPLNFSLIALFKGLLYNEENLNKLYEFSLKIKNEDIIKSKEEAIDKGLNGKFLDTSLKELGKNIIKYAKGGLNEDEIQYIKPLEEIITKGKVPAEIIKENLKLGKKEALSWCIINKKI